VVQFKARPLLLLIDTVGGVLSNVVVTLACDVHPFAPVTVTVNVPAVLTVIDGVVCTGVVFHEYDTPPLAVRVVVVVLQFKASPLSLLIVAVTVVLSNVVLTLVCAVHPLAPVTVTVKVPAVLTVIDGVVCTGIVFHEYDTPPLAVRVVPGVVQLKARPLLLLIDGVGGVLSNVVVALACDVHPLAPVTVTVYVPAVLTVIDGVVCTGVVFHEYDTPPLAVSVVPGVVQLKASPLLLVTDTVGSVLSNVVVTLACDVHPFAPVTVTVNVPAVLTVIDGVV